MMTTQSLWSPFDAGAIRLPHRLAMAPMTRGRSTPDGVPAELNAEYYAQRASTALIITEGTQPSEDGQGYLLLPASTPRGRSRAGGASPTRSTRRAGGS